MVPISQSLIIYQGLTFNFSFVLRAELSEIGTFTVSTSTDAVTLTTHGLVVGDPIRFAPVGVSTLPAPLATNTTYYVVTVVDANTFKFSDTYNGFHVDIIDTGVGTFICLTNRPVDLTGWAASAHVRTAPEQILIVDLTPAIDGDPTTGKIDLSKTDEATVAYTPGNYRWDLLVEDDGGQKLGPVFSGNCQIIQTITTPASV